MSVVHPTLPWLPWCVGSLLHHHWEKNRVASRSGFRRGTVPLCAAGGPPTIRGPVSLTPHPKYDEYHPPIDGPPHPDHADRHVAVRGNHLLQLRRSVD